MEAYSVASMTVEVSKVLHTLQAINCQIMHVLLWAAVVLTMHSHIDMKPGRHTDATCAPASAGNRAPPVPAC